MQIFRGYGSFKRQIVLTYTAGFFILIGVFAAYLVRTESGYLYRDSYNEAAGLAELLAVSSASWVLADDVVGLQEVIRAFQSHPGTRYAMVLSPQGRVLAHSDPAKVGLYASDRRSLALIKAPPKKQAIIDSRSVIDIAVPIMAGVRHIAWARVALGRTRITDNLHRMIMSSALFMLLAAALAFLSAWVIANRLGSRIGSLVRVAEEVQAGNFDARADTAGPSDEIAKLASGLNRMLEVLAQTIAGQKRVEKALRESEAKSRRILETASEGFWMFGPDALTTSVNARMADMLAYSVEEMIGKPMTAFMLEEDAHEHTETMANRRRGTSEHYERKIPLQRRKDRVDYRICHTNIR